MGVPKIKIYVLPPGYTTAGDQDIQRTQGDELLPCVDRSELLDTAVLLDPIVPVNGAQLTALDIGTPRTNYPLIPSAATVQTPSGVAYEDLLKNVTGALELVVYDSHSAVVPPYNELEGIPASGQTRWQYDTDGFKFYGPPPSGGHVSAYLVDDSNPATTWALPSTNFYEGENPSFNSVSISVNYGSYYRVTTDDGIDSGYVTTVGASSVRVRMAWVPENNLAKHFIGANPNWVVEHMRMWPDIFKGTTDYPGDNYETVVNNVAVSINPGVLPKYVEPTEYQLRPREGMVIFPTLVDHTATPVKAIYAYLAGIHNVTSQKLDAVPGSSGRQYYASSETAWPNSHGKPWVNRNSVFMPLNVYVNGVLSPTITTVAPYEVLTPILPS